MRGRERNRDIVYYRIYVRKKFALKYESNQLCSFLAAGNSASVNFAFVLTPRSAVKCSRQTRRIFSTITNSLMTSITDNKSQTGNHVYNLLFSISI